MKTKIAKSYDKMWKAVSGILSNISKDKYMEDNPYIDLVLAIVISAARDYDHDYFNSVNYETHCKLLKLKKEFVSSAIKMAWKQEKSGKLWEPL